MPGSAAAPERAKKRRTITSAAIWYAAATDAERGQAGGEHVRRGHGAGT